MTGEMSSPSFSTLFHTRKFVVFFGAQVVAQSALLVLAVAIVWLVLITTGSILDVGGIVLEEMMIPIAVAPFAGVLVDRWNRRNTLAAVYAIDGVGAVALAWLVNYHSPDYFAVLALNAVFCVGEMFAIPAWGGIVPRLVATEQLGAANGLLSVAGSINTMAGYGLGGIAIGITGIYAPISYCFVAFFVAAVAIIPIGAIAGRPSPGEPSGDQEPLGFGKELRGGFSYIRRNRLLLQILVIGSVTGLLTNGLQVLWSPYADFTLHSGAAAYGFLIASASVGTMLGALWLGRTVIRNRAGLFNIIGLAGQGVAIAALGLVRSPSLLWLAIALKLPVGIFQAFASVSYQSILQARVDGRLYGRVSSSMNAAFSALGPLSVLFTIPLATHLTIPNTFLLYGILMVAMVVGLALPFRELREASY